MSETDILSEENSYQIAARMQTERIKNQPVILVQDKKTLKAYPAKSKPASVAGVNLFSKMPAKEITRVRDLFFKKK